MKVKMYTHTDLDGIGCYIILKKFFSKDVEIDVSFISPKDVNEIFNSKNEEKIKKDIHDSDYDYVFITDLNLFNHSTTININNYYQRDVIIHIDHHILKEDDDYDKNDRSIYIDTSYSATYLLYEYLLNKDNSLSYDLEKEFVRENFFSNEGLKRFAFTVSQWDTFAWKKDEAKGMNAVYLNEVFKFLGAERFVQEFLNLEFKGKDGDYYKISPSYKKIISIIMEKDANKAISKLLGASVRNNYLVIIGGEVSVGTISQVIINLKKGEKYNLDDNSYILLLEKINTADYIKIYLPSINTVSLRSLNDYFDVQKIAVKKGGGGHPKAAGYQFSINLQDNLIDYLEILEDNM